MLRSGSQLEDLGVRALSSSRQFSKRSLFLKFIVVGKIKKSTEFVANLLCIHTWNNHIFPFAKRYEGNNLS